MKQGHVLVRQLSATDDNRDRDTRDLRLSSARVAAYHPGGMKPVVTTLAGEVRGSAYDSGYAFPAVPYAAPSGPNRLLPPQPVEPWACARRHQVRAGAASGGTATDSWASSIAP